jgi:hypothetical protein
VHAPIHPTYLLLNKVSNVYEISMNIHAIHDNSNLILFNFPAISNNNVLDKQNHVVGLPLVPLNGIQKCCMAIDIQIILNSFP